MERPATRVLLVSGFFPPYAPMAGVRSSKFAKHLLSRGYDVRVLAAKDLPFPPVLPLEIPAERVVYTPSLDINGFPKLVASWRNRLRRTDGPRRGPRMSADDRAGDGGGATNGGWLRKLSAAYTEMTNWPDPQAGWLPFALRGGRRLLREWRADVIYASAPPLTGLLVARALSRRFGIPWIAELRDLWVDHPYYEAPAWRRRLERRQEAAVLGSADRLVTVTTPWADLLQERFGQRPEIILNGFDPEDYPADPIESGGGRDELTIVYTGTLYGGRRDPSPLFSAIRSLGAAGRTIRVHFYGAEGGDVELSAAAAGIQDQVRVHPPRPYREIVRIQRSADILLLLRWADDQENGVIPGKVFEYLGARRPILSVGFEGGEVADLIRQRKAGLVSNDPDAIARALSAWLAEKRSGGLADLPLESRLGLSRAEQFATLERLLDSVGRRNLSDPANLLANGRVAGVAMR